MDIVDSIGIRLNCRSCGRTYDVPLRDILMSHDLLEHQGCPISEDTECPPIAQVFLADDKDISDLQRAWQRLQERARSDGGELVLMGSPEPKSASKQTEAA